MIMMHHLYVEAEVKQMRKVYYDHFKSILSKYKITDERISEDYSVLEFYLECKCLVLIVFSGLAMNRVSVVTGTRIDEKDSFLNVTTLDLDLSDFEKWVEEAIEIVGSIRLSKEL